MTPRPPADPAAPALSRELIVDRAVAVAERDGAARLSLRRLGEELGVDATAVYRYFRDKDDLVLAMADHVTGWVLERLREGSGEDTDWRDLLRLLADLSWHASEVFPATQALTLGRTTGQAAEREMVELVLARMASLGLDPARTVLAYRAFVDVVLALTGVNATVESLEEKVRTKDAESWSRIYAVSPRSTYPQTSRHAAELVAVTDRAVFDLTVEALLVAIAARRFPDVR